MAIFGVDGFDSGPHWDVALVEANDEVGARAVLAAKLARGEVGTVVEVQPESDWHVVRWVEPLCFVLGGGCR